MQKVNQSQVHQPSHLHSPSLEVKSSGWITHRISVTGEKTKWRLLMLEFHTGPLSSRLSLRDQTSMVLLQVLIRSQPSVDQPSHPLNLLREVKSNGWITLPTLKFGATSKSKLPMREFHTLPLSFKSVTTKRSSSTTIRN